MVWLSTRIRMNQSLKIRVEFNKGRVGMPLPKLVAAASGTVRFLDLLARDLGIQSDPSNWVAERFENGSVDFDCRLARPLAPASLALGRRALRQVFTDRYDDPEVASLIRSETRRQFARIAEPLDSDETARFGLYTEQGPNPEEWYVLGHERFQELDAVAEAGPREVWGEVQGVVHAFFKEVERPYLKIRELSTRQLVNCYFEPAMYGAAVEILSDPQAVVFVEGWLKEDRETGQVTDIEVTDFRLAPEFSLASYRAGLGAVPDYTGALSTSEFIDRMRHHGQ